MDVYDTVGYELKRAQQALNGALARALTAFDLTPSAYSLLSTLDASPGLSNAEAARRSFVTPQSTHQLLTGLVERGLVTREPDPDHGRVLRVHLSAEGRRTLRAAHEAVLAVERDMLAGLRADDVRALKGALAEVARALEARDAADS